VPTAWTVLVAIAGACLRQGGRLRCSFEIATWHDRAVPHVDGYRLLYFPARAFIPANPAITSVAAIPAFFPISVLPVFFVPDDVAFRAVGEDETSPVGHVPVAKASRNPALPSRVLIVR
jgi:hypothetical protein